MRERSGQAYGSLGIVGLAQVGEHATCVGVTESVPQRVQEHRVSDLLPTVRAKTRGDQRGGRNHVVRGERRRRDPLRRVVAVDPGRIGVHQREDLRPYSALRANGVDLIRQERLGLRARDEALARQRERQWIEPRHVERSDPRGAANELEEETAIGRRDPARSVGDVRLGLPVDVSDAEVVAHDLHARSRALALVSGERRRTERSRLEHAADVSRRDVAQERRQRVVELCLVARVLVERDAAVLSRRQDRPRRGRVVARRGCLERREHDRRRCDASRQQRGKAADHVRDGTQR